MINYTLMFVQKKDNENIIEAFDDYQEKKGMIKRVEKDKWEVTVFGKNATSVQTSLEKARRFIENNY